MLPLPELLSVPDVPDRLLPLFTVDRLEPWLYVLPPGARETPPPLLPLPLELPRVEWSCAAAKPIIIDREHPNTILKMSLFMTTLLNHRYV